MFKPKNLGDILGSAPADKVAVFDVLDPLSVIETTYEDLNILTHCVALGLKDRGLRPGDRVAFLAENRTEYIAAYLGAMRSGIVPVPISFRLPQSTIDFILRDADIKLCFADELRLSHCQTVAKVIVFGRSGADGFDAFLGQGVFEEFEASPNDIGMILYTSGSSGRPKGVPLSHHGQLWAVNARNRAAPDLAEHRFLVAAPLFHMNALFATKFILAGGASLVLLPRFDPKQFIRAIENYKCTWLTSVPTMMAMIAREKESIATADFSSVRVAAMGSAPVTDSLIDLVKSLFPKARVVINYGTTEGGAAVFGNHPQGLPRPAQSIGYPLGDIGLRLVDGDNHNADEGVLQISTPAVMSSYLNLPELTKKVITKDGYYITGDIVRRDTAGFFYFVGRADDMFVCGGENIFPEQVERMLEQQSTVQQACIVPVPDEIKGMKPVAFVVLKEGTLLDEDAIKQHALANASAYQHPRQVFQIDTMPLAGTNKIDRLSLRKRALEFVNNSSWKAN